MGIVRQKGRSYPIKADASRDEFPIVEAAVKKLG